ncbi:bifunctional Gfo/Idh/MocA family oxidoreductase/class I SAM-dependent methyltransferase [uncultured Desulfobacter sp.]|uniref:bifunctional Gfo/Idh/MocA family oxidoreductase/class I SAM-dependent methyltransferase n=1 Tax=uncultured Desulfobacter sp. TaxID=240139 RepID=UPI0029C66A0B|nr:bifunctional Gfo/Idh/MocA family oxidoreductase/class I SAM-dependent methyltransferase [uncultured Desulfobacter sp.]
MTKNKIKTVVCGSTFGQFYLKALEAYSKQFELVGILAKGSKRSKECAKHYGIDLYTDIEQLPPTVGLACVIIRSGALGGTGTDLSLKFLKRGIHVIQEQPIHYKEAVSCLRTALQYGVHFRIANLYVQLPAVRRFIACAQELLKRQNALYLDAACAIHVSYPMIRILSEALPTIRPWKINHVIKDNGPFQIISGTLGNIPMTLRVHNEINPQDPDNHLHLLHCLTIGVEGGRLSLVDTHGPLVWHPRLHVPHSHSFFGDPLEADPAHLTEPNSLMLGSDHRSYKEILMKQWPAAIGRELSSMRELINDSEDKGATSAQRELLFSKKWHYLTNTIGQAVLMPNCRHQAIPADILQKAALKIVEEFPKENGDYESSPIMEKNNDIFNCTENAESVVQGINPKQIKTFVDRTDEAVLSSMLFTLQSQGTLINRNQGYGQDEIFAALKTDTRHRHLILRWLQELVRFGYLRQYGESYQPTAHITRDVMDQRWKLVNEIWDNKFGSPLILEYFLSNVRRLPQLITNRQQAVSILFPQGRMDDFAKPLYESAISARYMNESVAEGVVRIAETKQAPLISSTENTLTIMEIGAGTGATTKAVTSRLKTWDSKSLKLDYVFTDISRFFLAPAREQFKEYPWMHFQVFDMEQGILEQGIKPDSVDIVIAVGVLNNAHNINKVIQNIMKIIVPGGWMFTIETVNEPLSILISQAFMMRPPEDNRKITKTTFMSANQWKNVFYQENVKRVAALPEEEHILNPFGQKLFIVQKN